MLYHGYRLEYANGCVMIYDQTGAFVCTEENYVTAQEYVDMERKYMQPVSVKMSEVRNV